MGKSLYTELSANYTPELPLADRENLSVKEGQARYKLSFGKKRPSVAYRVDGNIIKSGNRCDYLILAKQEDPKGDDEKWKAIFVELKGTDVPHALKQLDASLSESKLNHTTVNERHARIVAKSFPANKANPAYEKAKRAFKTRHKDCTLKQITSGNPDLIP